VLVSVSSESGPDSALRGRLILETPNPLDLDPADLAMLAGEIANEAECVGLPPLDCRVASEEPLGVANNFTDFLIIFMPNTAFVTDRLWEVIVQSAAKFMRTRFRRPHEQHRTRRVLIYDHLGRPLKAVDIPDETAELDITDLDSAPPRDPPTRYR
jgi:hypothetical protein